MAAPSCLCVCGARGGLAHVGHTCRPASARAVPRGLAQVGRTCRAAWVGAGRAHVPCRVGESLKDFCELLRLSVFARPAWAITCWRATAFTAARIACSATSIRSTGWNSTTSTLPMPTRSRRADVRLDSEADTRQAGNRRAPAAPFGRPRKRGGPYRRLGAGDRVTLLREEKSPRLRVLPGAGAPGCGLVCDSEWSSR